jgi:hypothetical protein
LKITLSAFAQLSRLAALQTPLDQAPEAMVKTVAVLDTEVLNRDC